MYFPQIDLSFFQLFFQIVIIFSKQSALFFLTMDGNLRSSVPCISRERESSGQRGKLRIPEKNRLIADTVLRPREMTTLKPHKKPEI